jgi:predicted phage gp36 major capsid-like protein
MSEEEVKRNRFLPRKTIDQQLEYAEKSSTVDAISRMSTIFRDLQEEITRLGRRFSELEEENRKLQRSVEGLISSDADDLEEEEEKAQQKEMFAAGLQALMALIAPKPGPKPGAPQ